MNFQLVTQKIQKTTHVFRTEIFPSMYICTLGQIWTLSSLITPDKLSFNDPSQTPSFLIKQRL